MLSSIRAIFRLLFFAIGSSFYITRYLVKAFFVGDDLNRALRLLRQWTRILSPALGLQVQVEGTIPTTAGLLVCNHRSYVDPFLLFRDVPAVPVGKAAVANWPIIGLAGKLAGAVYIDRRSPESRLKSRKAIAERLQNGFFVINFAEGTTHIQPQTTPFKPGLFKEAAIANFPIYPVALDYQETTDAWIGDDTFIRHFMECFGKPATFAKVHYGPALYADQADVLLEQTKTWIDRKLLDM